MTRFSGFFIELKKSIGDTVISIIKLYFNIEIVFYGKQ